jgi:hypothetical protein
MKKGWSNFEIKSILDHEVIGIGQAISANANQRRGGFRFR